MRAEESAPIHRPSSSRAAEALARVSARYAKAPSYSEALAGDAQAVVRAAEAAGRAAAQAQQAAENMLAGLEAVRRAEARPEAEDLFTRESASLEMIASESAVSQPEAVSAQSYEVRWGELLPELHEEPAASAGGATEIYEMVSEGWQEPVASGVAMEHAAVEEVEAGQPIPGNLIEFPRELVAARRMRPRLAEGVLASASEESAQLSIFEVDPATVSQTVENVAVEPVASNSIWARQEWQNFELAAETEEELEALSDVRLPAVPTLDPAPASMRMMAAMVNLSLVTGAFLGAAAVAVHSGWVLPGARTVEIGAGVGLAITGVLYALLFYVMGDGTPGMHYAHMRLANFEGRRTTRRERLARLGALALSILPLGLGLAWMLFDEENLCWHDRLSRTYLRRY